MLSENIKKNRKLKNMSQDELAEKLNVTRQSISLWETGQTQPSLDNIVALSKLFNVSTDALLNDDKSIVSEAEDPCLIGDKSKKKKAYIQISIVSSLVVCALLVLVFLLKITIFDFQRDDTGEVDKLIVEDMVEFTEHDNLSYNAAQSAPVETEKADNENQQYLTDKNQENQTPTQNPVQTSPEQSDKFDNQNQNLTTYTQENNTETQNPVQTSPEHTGNPDNQNQDILVDKPQENQPEIQDATQTQPQQSEKIDKEDEDASISTVIPESPKDIYGYLKNFVIQNGVINGDYCYYSKSADNYGGYSSENFNLYYWADTEKVEFCLHSVLDDTFSVAFYLYVPEIYTGNYEYISSYYYRDTGESLYEAKGTIRAEDFTKKYPLNCTRYIGSTEAQDDFMEMSRQGICDLIDCIKQFVSVEKLEYSFYDFGFTKF